jgi:Zn-dependent protease with chaperone function
MTRADDGRSKASSPGNDDHELLQTVGSHIVRISNQTGLPEPEIVMVDHTGSGKASLNAQVRSRGDVSVVDVTRRAACELHPDALAFLLVHEFGHLGHTAFTAVRRWLIAAYIVGSVLIMTTVIAYPFVVISRQAPPWFIPIGVIAVVLVAASWLTLQAYKRSSERRADAFAVTQLGHLAGAEEFFAALEADEPEKVPATRFRRSVGLLIRSHPYHHQRLASMRAVLAGVDPVSGTSAP